MASHESYYSSSTPQQPITSPRPSAATAGLPATSPSGPPPPPPPKPLSHDPSRTSTPSNGAFQQQPPLPPHPSQVQSPVPPSQRAQSVSSPAPQYGGHQQQQSAQQHQPISVPPINSGWLPPSLDSHTTSDLQGILGNSQVLTALAQQHPAYASSLEPLQQAIDSNLALAQQVAQLETQLKQLRDQTGQLMLNHTSLQTQWRRKQSEMDDALSPWGPRAMYQRLVSSISEQEALLRAVHESFLEGGGGGHEYYGGDGKATEKEVTEWVKRIREGTTTLEKRREMRARWDDGRVGGWR